ncbi:hypothetical protein BT69DRAFT_58131 [Atractiella rhizophila]|nr:hypothetical protein BT69DRAFT_58131 [Atractiella rhizophila]
MFPSFHNVAKQRNHFSFGSFEQQINLVVSFRDSPDLNTSAEPQSLGENLNTLNNVSNSPSSSKLPTPSPFTALPSTRPNNFLSLPYNSESSPLFLLSNAPTSPSKNRKKRRRSLNREEIDTNERTEGHCSDVASSLPSSPVSHAPEQCVKRAQVLDIASKSRLNPDVPSGSEHPLPFQVPSVGHGTHLLPAACIDPPSVTSLLVSTSPFVRSFEIPRPSLAAPLGPLQPFPLLRQIIVPNAERRTLTSSSNWPAIRPVVSASRRTQT